MFTGLIERIGQIRRVTRQALGVSLSIGVDAGFVAELALGDSVAVNGVCLTVTSKLGDFFTVDVSAESLSRSVLKHVKPNDSVQLERALRLGDRLGGHLVTGHVDAVGRLVRVESLGESLQLWFEAPAEIARFLVEKGSIAIDGASLTINAVCDQASGARFSVVLIPHSQEKLLLSQKSPGAEVDLEADIIGKYVERLLGRGGEQKTVSGESGVTLDLLARAGFM